MVLFVVLFILSLDQLTKFLISRNFALNQPLAVIKGIFYITLVHNRGAAFGILRDQVWLFILISIIAILLIFFNLKKSEPLKVSLYTISLSLILAGGLGNLIDRIVYGYVVDFLDFRVWPVFNIADSAITIGAVLLGWQILFSRAASRKLY